MIKRPIKDYILIGASIRFLQDSKVNHFIKGPKYVTGNIERLFKELDKLELQVTKRASRDLNKFLEELNKLSNTAKLNQIQCTKLVDLVTTLRKTLEAETEGIFAIIITEKRYSINKLQNIRSLLDNGIYDKLSDLARYDLDECGHCICFERSTAAAFHLLRATEEVLKQFHRKFIKTRPTGFMTWGNYTTALRSKTTGKKPETTILNHLDNIRVSYRNPTQHPDKIYDMEEIQNLLGVCLDVINRMSKTL